MNAQQFIGEQIKNLRIQHKMSQAELARKLNVSDSIISGYERGVRTPSIEVLLNLKDTFGVSLDYFITDEIEKHARLMVDLTDLTDDQFMIIAKLIDQFSKYNELTKKEND
ncbi:MAG: helix-turn-helix transcriptional regulator [Erysipelotrichaceae bacterium]|nr:helix-turn-helix transcriptional regulator [Erysipelotrichaceae bacterium]